MRDEITGVAFRNLLKRLWFTVLLCAGLLVEGVAADFTPQWRISKGNAKYV